MKKWIPWLVAAVFAGWFAAGTITPKAGEGFDLAGFGRLPVLLNGRVQPFDSVARNALLSMSGRSTTRSAEGKTISATQWLLETMTNPTLADQRKIFRVQHPDLQGLLGADKSGLLYYSWKDLSGCLDTLEEQAAKLQAAESREGEDAAKLRTPFQKDLLHLYDSAALYNRLRQNFALDSSYAYVMAVPPLPGAPRQAWSAVAAAAARGPHPALEFFRAMSIAYQQNDPASFNRAVAGYRGWMQENNLAAELSKGGQEFFFNQIEPFYKSMVIYVAAVILGCVFWINLSEPVRRTGFALLVVAFLIHTVGLGFRMYLEGRPPVTNLYSSAIFIGWGAAALGLVLERIFKGGIGLVASGLIGFSTLIIAHHLALSGDTMEMLRAVLDTNLWLATHVVVITLGYASMFVAGLLAAIYIVRGFFTRGLSTETARGLARMVYGIVCFATLTSFAGTILGGIWADQSWGRFWGWDPKENGALLIVLWNAMILHARWGGVIKERGLMAMAVFGNIVTSFSWFGVNMLGVGLHAYGFMDKALFWLIAFDVSQAVLIAAALAPTRFWASFNRAPASPQSAG
ncbi:MAG TPA: cytochrome c biogenesis protein CcsA [Verrucomicrobiae bacterium]|jgi:ABC-type transport system involved in cytochrome c biogenesis permease subunit|nr:cytochrome c biogenesis protein CcsA [Verrucomicrobiae bacterium]